MDSIAKKLYVATVMPFDEKGDIDEAGYRRLIQYFMQDRFRAIGGLCVNPEAGEVFYLSRGEKKRAVEIAVEESDGKMPVIAGTYATNTAEVVETAKDVKAAGGDGLFAIPPGGCGDVTGNWDADNYPEVWINELKAQADAVDMPIVTHPAGCKPTPVFGRGIPVGAAKKIIEEIPQVVGWKMTYPYEGNRQLATMLRSLERPVAILQAAAQYFHENLANGHFDGTLSGFWNYALEPMLDHIEAWQQGNVIVATRIWNSGLRELHDYVYSNGRLHIHYKIAAWLRGLIDRPYMRPPMPPPREDEIETIYRLMKKVGIPVIGEKAMKNAL